MKIDFSQVIMTPYDEPVKDGPGTDSLDMTLARASIGALLANRSDEQKLNGQEKAIRHALAVLLVNGGEIDLEIEQIALIKKLVGEVYGPLVVGPAYKMLENENKEE